MTRTRPKKIGELGSSNAGGLLIVVLIAGSLTYAVIFVAVALGAEALILVAILYLFYRVIKKGVLAANQNQQQDQYRDPTTGEIIYTPNILWDSKSRCTSCGLLTGHKIDCKLIQM